jgi:hypothetical protein
VSHVRIAHYYHAYAHRGWEVIVDEYLDALVRSAFVEAVDSVRLGVVGRPAKRRSLVNHLRERVPVTVIAAADTGWEQLTLSRIVETLNGADIVMYAHTKGVTLADEVNALWRREMIRVVIEEWRDRVNDMESYDSAGAFQIDDSPDQPAGREI